MEFLELARARFSTRKFSGRPVEEEKLREIIEAGRVAPTAKNSQPQKVYVIKSPEALARINEVSACIYGAPQVLMVAYDKKRAAENDLNPGLTYAEQDCAIVMTHMMLEAFDLGVDSCWVGRFDRNLAAEKMGLPEDEVPVALLPFGYRAEGEGPSPRHSDIRPESETVAVL